MRWSYLPHAASLMVLIPPTNAPVIISSEPALSPLRLRCIPISSELIAHRRPLIFITVANFGCCKNAVENVIVICLFVVRCQNSSNKTLSIFRSLMHYDISRIRTLWYMEHIHARWTDRFVSAHKFVDCVKQIIANGDSTEFRFYLVSHCCCSAIFSLCFYDVVLRCVSFWNTCYMLFNSLS